MQQSRFLRDLGLARSQDSVNFRWVRGRHCTLVSEPVKTRRGGLVLQGTNSPDLQFSPADFDNASTDLFTDGSLNVSRSTITWDKQAGNRSPEVLVCTGEGERYDPFAEAPEAYLRFAAIGRQPEGDPVVWWDRVSDEAMAFVEAYGLPRPGNFLLESTRGLPLNSFIHEAGEMWHAVQYLIAASLADYEADYSLLKQLVRPATKPVDQKQYLVSAARVAMFQFITNHIMGIHPLPGLEYTERGIALRPGYTCDSLFSAMWLQYYLTAVEGRRLRPVCKGCGRPYEAADKRQKYCDPYCRHATNQRAYYRKTKETRK